MKMNQEYIEGLLAGLAGWESFDCPYPESPLFGENRDRTMWKQGWAQGNLYFTALKLVAQG